MFYSFDFWCLWGPTSHGDSLWHSVQFSMIFLSLIQAYDHVFFSILWPSHNIWTFPFLDLWNIHISNQIFLIVFFIWYLKAYLCLLKRVKGFKGVTDYCIQLTQNDDYFFFHQTKSQFQFNAPFYDQNSPVCCAFFDEVLFSKPIFVYMAWKDGGTRGNIRWWTQREGSNGSETLL